MRPSSGFGVIADPPTPTTTSSISAPPRARRRSAPPGPGAAGWSPRPARSTSSPTRARMACQGRPATPSSARTAVMSPPLRPAADQDTLGGPGRRDDPVRRHRPLLVHPGAEGRRGRLQHRPQWRARHRAAARPALHLRGRCGAPDAGAFRRGDQRERRPLLGLTPQGHDRPGSDADLVVYDPAPRWTVRHEDSTTGPTTPYAGLAIQGRCATSSCAAHVVRAGEPSRTCPAGSSHGAGCPTRRSAD